ncbi:DUF4811 domain-containing protein [Lactovum miscens]|uniref:DUF4811 domain-containing protein n=1 Tax=Lactovum miscens TaxID=190387 RepID=A0A841C818_9LACT|nr:DUF4811 domain-containing protein [Lactovum miscens]MBB5887868.1 hypothetical protein [Lactovum miscens]
MIIILIALFTLLTFFSWMYIKNKSTKIILGIITFLALALSVFGLSIHITNHWGMKEVTATSSKTIYSAGDPKMSFGMLITKKMGNKSILVYKTSANTKDTTLSINLNTKSTSATFLSDNAELINTTSSVKFVDSDKANMVTKITKLEFTNGFTKALFGFGGETGTVMKTVKIAELPKDSWMVLTADQAATLQKKSAGLAAQQKAVAAQLQVAIATAPNPEAKAAIEAKAQEAMSPQAEIAQIKSILGIN